MSRLLWGEEPEAGRRGPRRSLTVEGITAAAIAVATTDGLAALSMARLARDLGVTTMALYRYVDGKAEILALMSDAMVPDPYEAMGEPDQPWRTAMERWMTLQIAQIERHPWALELPLTTIDRGPRSLRWIDWAMGALRTTPLHPGQRLAVIGLLASFTLAEGRLRVEYARSRAETAGSSGGTVEHIAPEGEDEVVTTILAHLDDPRFAHLREAFGAWHQEPGPAVDDSYDDAFAVTTVLDGVEAFIARQERAGPSPSSGRA